MDTSFNQNEFDLAYSDGVENNYWNITRNHILLDSLKKNKLNRNAIIEIGCGRGIVVDYLARMEINCYGIELAIVKPLNEKNILTGKNAIDMNQGFKQKFQTLMLLDVIEHIENPVEFIDEILKHYKNVNSIIITVPAQKELWSNYDEFYGHFRRYDLNETKKTIDAIGYEIKELRYFFHSLYLPAKITLWIFKKRKLKMMPPKGVAKYIHKIIAAIMIFENSFIPNKWRGTSILCVAKRKE